VTKSFLLESVLLLFRVFKVLTLLSKSKREREEQNDIEERKRMGDWLIID